MIIRVINRQKAARPATRKIRALLLFLMRRARPDFARSARAGLNLLLTDDENIRKLKLRFFEVDCVTDVISFSSRPHAAGGRDLAAELVVNAEQACREGKRRGSIAREFALYLAHGCDHLAGHDDRTDGARAKMRRRELRWLREASRMRLLRGLLREWRPAASR